MLFTKFSSPLAWSTSTLHQHDFFLSSLSGCGTNLPATWCMPKFSAKISWPMVFEIQTSSAVSWMVKQWLEQINFLDVFCLFWCWRLSWTFIVLNLNSALFKTFVPLMGLCSTSGFVRKCFFLTFQKSPKMFSLIWNKISHKQCC